MIYVALHRPPPDVRQPYHVVRDDRDAPESRVSVISPLADVPLTVDSIAREIVTEWWGWLMPWYAGPGEGAAEATYLAARARLAEYCTAEERSLLYRVDWSRVLAEAQRTKRAARWYCQDALRGNYGPGDLFDRHVPRSARLRSFIADLRDRLWSEICRIGEAVLDVDDRHERDLEALMQEPPHNVTGQRAHAKHLARPWRLKRDE